MKSHSLISVLLMTATLAFAAADPVRVGLDAEFGNKTSTADDAIKLGMEIAIEEINQSGGVLKGRPLELVTRDNRGVPARGVDNLKELAQVKDMTALVTSKFSPVVLAQLESAHQLKLPLLAAWSAADGIIDHDFKPSYSFRLSLRDGWVMPRLLQEAKARGYKKVGLLIPNGAWGRSNLKAAEAHATKHPQPAIVKTMGFEWSDTSLENEYLDLLQAGMDALLFVGNEPEVALLIKNMTALPREQWRPILSHWGVAAGNLPALTGAALHEVDLSTVQTFSFIDNPAPKARRVLESAVKKLGVQQPRDLISPVGIAHGYDLVHLLAIAINKTGATDREGIRNALEQIDSHDGLVRKYKPPFSHERHEALGPEQLFMARWRKDGSLIPAKP